VMMSHVRADARRQAAAPRTVAADDVG